MANVTADEIVAALKAREARNLPHSTNGAYSTRFQIAGELDVPPDDISSEVTVGAGPDGPLFDAISAGRVEQHPTYLEFKAV